jgi:hypothetical protein
MRRVVITLAVLLTGCGSQAQAPDQPEKLNPAGNYVHSATGFTFPPVLGAFKRSGITEYNREKTDVSAGYDKVANAQSVATTVYIYPAPPLTSIGSPQAVIDDAKEHLCTQVWEGIKADIARAHPDAELVALDEIPSPSPVFKDHGHRATFRFTGDFGGSNQPLRSEADLFCYAGGDWLVAYRTTAPAAFDYRADLTTLMRALRWPSSLTR